MNKEKDTWDLTVNSPLGVKQSVLYTFVKGRVLEGSMVGEVDGETKFTNGSVDGDVYVWSADIDKPMSMTLTFKGTLKGDMLSGDVKFGSFGSGKFDAKRKL